MGKKYYMQIWSILNIFLNFFFVILYWFILCPQAEEAHLINQLAETGVVNHNLLEQAYEASLDACKFLDYYEMSRLLAGRYDKQGACVILQAGTEGPASQVC
jgi:hypothetical protein